jgi:hypothetical protein
MTAVTAATPLPPAPPLALRHTMGMIRTIGTTDEVAAAASGGRAPLVCAERRAPLSPAGLRAGGVLGVPMVQSSPAVARSGAKGVYRQANCAGRDSAGLTRMGLTCPPPAANLAPCILSVYVYCITNGRIRHEHRFAKTARQGVA